MLLGFLVKEFEVKLKAIPRDEVQGRSHLSLPSSHMHYSDAFVAIIPERVFVKVNCL